MSSTNEIVCPDFDSTSDSVLIGGCLLILVLCMITLRLLVLNRRFSIVMFVRIQIYHPKGNANHAVMEICDRLLKEVHKFDERIHVVYERISSVDDLNKGQLLFIICVNESRLVTDAKGAINQIKDLESALLLVIHHTQEYAQPSISSSKILVSPEFQRLSGIIDLAYLTDYGMYECDMNTNAFKHIVGYVLRYIKTQ